MASILDDGHKQLAMELLHHKNDLLDTCRKLERLAASQDDRSNEIILSLTGMVRYCADGLRDLAVGH